MRRILSVEERLKVIPFPDTSMTMVDNPVEITIKVPDYLSNIRNIPNLTYLTYDLSNFTNWSTLSNVINLSNLPNLSDLSDIPDLAANNKQQVKTTIM